MKPRIIILYNQLFHYRIPVWNCLAEKCDLTVAYSQGNGKVPEGTECKFKVMFLPAYEFKGRVAIQKANIRKLVKDYDAIICYGDVTWLKYSTLPWLSKNRVIFHTIGVSAGYKKEYDAHREWDRIRAFFYRRAAALAFYTDYPIAKYEALGIPREHLFVAPNTVAVAPVADTVEKDSILMIGTLYREKGLQLLLDVYKSLKGRCSLPVLNIVGKGPDYEPTLQWVKENGMEDLVKLRGAIYDINEKAKYFARSIACISPKQAGLTVLESMGYGVPFVSTRNAITGGELQNVHNGVNGVVMESESELEDVVLDIATNTEKYLEMGRKAQEYYNSCRTPEHMAAGLWDAVCYALGSDAKA